MGNSIGGSFVAGGLMNFVLPESTRKTIASENKAEVEIGSLLIARRVPVKVEPKVHLGNERTLLAWLQLLMFMAAASISIVQYGRSEDLIVNQLYGIVILPVSLAFMGYAVLQYIRRSEMITEHAPGPYADTVAPVTLTLIISTLIVVQFCTVMFRNVTVQD